MAEVNFDELFPEAESDETQGEAPQEETTDAVEPETDEESAPEKEAADSEPKSRANDRIRQLVDEKNELKSRLEALEKLQEGLTEKLKGVLNPEPEPEPEVEFLEDPKGYVDVNRERLEKRIAALEKQDLENANDLKQELQMLKFQQTVHDYEREFTAEHPDYLKALEYNVEYRKEELALMGVTKDEEVRRIIAQETMMLAGSNIQNQKNPAEAAYNLAVRRGYKPKVVDTDEVREELDEEVGRRQKALDAESMGSSSPPSGKVEEDPEEEGWALIAEGFADLYGEKAAKEIFGRRLK